MERSEDIPIEISEEEYKSLRALLIESLRDDPQGLATFLIVERLEMLEREAHPQGEVHEISWYNGFSTAEYVYEAVSSDNSYFLPVPKPRINGNTDFGWWIAGSANTERNGWREMRISNEVDSFAIKAIRGRQLFPVSEDIVGLMENIPYPISVMDDHGFQYRNPAMIALRPE